MDDDLFTYEVGTPELCNTPRVDGQLDNLDNVNLVVYESKTQGDDEVVITEDELSDLEEELNDGTKIAKIFRIETHLFHFETPLCKAFKECNEQLQANVDREKGECNRGDLPGVIRIYNEIHFQNYKWYDGLEDGDLKVEALKEKAIVEGSWGQEHRKGMNFYAWVKKWTVNDGTIGTSQECFDEREPKEDDDDDIGDLDDCLIRNDAPFVINVKKELYKERMCKLLGIPYKRPPMCNFEKFDVIKYSLGPEEEYVAIKENEYNVWMTTEENVSLVYQDISTKRTKGGP
ncbi:hypothetical protein Tco_0283128 [Tanacetum coccineum]